MTSPSNIVEANLIRESGKAPVTGRPSRRRSVRRVFVLDRNKRPLMPCHPARAKELLDKGKAAVFRHYPFTVILKERAGGAVQPVAFKCDPGSRTTGVALVAESKGGKKVVWAAELKHRGQAVHDALVSRLALRRARRNRKCRYRVPRFLNRTRKPGWLPPSLESRISNIETWLDRLCRLVPVLSVSLELVKFDTQKMENPEISGIEYQQGELEGYKIREYLLEKWGRRCTYCGIENVPLEVEHIVPRSCGGSNRVSNLTIACDPCNNAKADRPVEEFLADKPDVLSRIKAQAKKTLRDAAVVNATWRVLFERLKAGGLPVECGTGGRTKMNRLRRGLPKMHWIDAACVGKSGEDVLVPALVPLHIRAIGHGKRQRCLTDAYGFPKAHAKRSKTFQGWRNGDVARATIPSGKHAGAVTGKVAIRHRPSFRIGKIDVHPKYLVRIHQSDGYEYHN